MNTLNKNKKTEVTVGSRISDNDPRFQLRAIKAAQVSLPHTSVVWSLAETKESENKYPHISVFSDEIHDSVVVDVDWLQKSASEKEGQEAKILAAVLDAERLCKGWRKFDLLYIHPQ